MIGRIVFLGTPEFAAPCLKMLIDEGYDIAAVVTQPDRPKGRGGKLAPPVIKVIAQNAGIRVFQPEAPSEIYEELTKISPDLCVTVAYGKILKKKFLRIPRFGTVNVHASLLPRYRGPSPIHRALQYGDTETGITTMLTDTGVDTGPVLLSEKILIRRDAYYTDLHDELAALGAKVLKNTIPALLAGELTPVPQDGELATYAPIVQKNDGELDFSWGAERLVNTIRAFGVWPGAYARIGGYRLKIHKADKNGSEKGGSEKNGSEKNGAEKYAGGMPGSVARVGRDALSVFCGDGRLINITRLQFENGRAMDISECWHNLRFNDP